MEVYPRFLKNSVVFTDKGDLKKKAQFNFKTGANNDMLSERHAAIANKKYKMKEIHPTLRSQYTKLMRTLDLVNLELALVSVVSLKKVVIKSHEAGVSCDSQTCAPLLFKVVNDIDDEIEEIKKKNNHFIEERKAEKKAAKAAAAAAAAVAAADSWEDMVEVPAVEVPAAIVAADSWEDMVEVPAVEVRAEEHVAEVVYETEPETDSDVEFEGESETKCEEKELDSKYIRCSDGFVMMRGHTRWSDSEPEYGEETKTCSDGFIMRGHVRWSDSDSDE
jgi:hypothetical protein